MIIPNKFNLIYLLNIVFFLLFSSSSFSNGSIEKIQWKGEINSKVITINNKFGDVRVRSSGNLGELEYLAVIQQLDENNQIDVSHTIKDGVFTLLSTLKFDKSTKSRIDITVFAPKGYPLSINTIDGLIEAKGLKNNLNLETVSGNISVKKNDGLINSKNNSGRTSLILTKDFKETQSFISTIGDISVLISEELNSQVEMSTSGDIISDFSMVVEKNRNKEPNKTAVIKINKASSKIFLYSKRGKLAMREYKNFLK